MNSDMLAYLQQDDIGKVIARGLADVYTNKPETPVKYLANWLKKYSANQQQKKILAHVEEVKDYHLNIYNQNQEQLKKKQADAEKVKANHQQTINHFKQKVESHEYQEELIQEQFPQFLEKELKLTGVYIGYLNHPVQDITDNDEDQNAHLNTSITKLINYVGTSKSHQALMYNKTLPLEKGVTGAAFSLSLQDSVPQLNEDGSQVAQEKKDKYVYISNVVKNQNIHYFRLPKLGAYIAVPLIYNSYLKEKIFDAALDSRIKYLDDLQEFKKVKADQIKQLEVEKDAHQHKIAELTQKAADEALIETAKAEYDEINRKLNDKRNQKFEQEHVELPSEKREFVVCADTLGSDREIGEKERQFLVEIVKHFRDSWQKKEHQLLYKDVMYQISLTKQIQKSSQAEIEHLDKCIEMSIETKTAFDQIEDEHLRQYKKEEWQLSTFKKQIQNRAQFLDHFVKLQNFRVVKFKDLIQTILYFLKHQKKEINHPGRTTLNWKKIKASKINEETFKAVLGYNPEGSKNGHYPEYCKIGKLTQKLEQFNELEIFDYNIGLGGLLKLIKKTLKHRASNIELRRIQKQNERKHRTALLEENQRITEQKRLALQKHKSSLAPEDVQAFKEEQWSAKYDEEFPLKQIPAEIVDDIDNDL